MSRLRGGSGRLLGSGTGYFTRKLAEAVKALPELGRELVESFRFDGVLDLVVKPFAAESALDDGHGEWSALGANDRLERRGFVMGDDLARDHFATGVFAAQIIGKVLRQLVQVGVAMGMSQHKKVVGPNAVGRPISEEESDLAGREDRGPALR